MKKDDLAESFVLPLLYDLSNTKSFYILSIKGSVSNHRKIIFDHFEELSPRLEVFMVKMQKTLYFVLAIVEIPW